jgi:hypothetical protein
MRFPYMAVDNAPTSMMPRLLLTLRLGNRSTDVVGLLDTGSAVNVLPYGIGHQLGAIWDEQTMPVPLVGSLGQSEARALIVRAYHPQLTLQAPIRLVFAWSQSEIAPVIFGQMNFFMEFNVCFYRSQGVFELEPKHS